LLIELLSLDEENQQLRDLALGLVKSGSGTY